MIKVRLARRGRTHRPCYDIVIADANASRDGRFIEKVGTYNPTRNPSHIYLKADRIMDWLFKGAQPTETVRRLCTAGGILLVKHVVEGVHKGAITTKVAHQRLARWEKLVQTRKKPKNSIETSLPVQSLIDMASYEKKKTTRLSRKHATKVAEKTAP